MSQPQILIGTAGSPGKSTLEGLGIVKKAGLEAMEVEFVRGVKMSIATAKEIAKENEKQGLSLSIHAPYYINLASADKAKYVASIKRILDSCERGHHLGARFIVFHAAYYGGKDLKSSNSGMGDEEIKERAFRMVEKAINEMQEIIEKKKWNVVLCPEIGGKKSQFGDVEELKKLHKLTGCGTCFDFAHLLARNVGHIDYKQTVKDFATFPEKLRTIHFSGIKYSDKGELSHLPIKTDETKAFLSELVKQKVNARIICEAPDPLGDALKMKKILANL